MQNITITNNGSDLGDLDLQVTDSNGNARILKPGDSCGFDPALTYTVQFIQQG